MSNKQTQDPLCKLFIGGLNYSTREDGLTETFSKYGNIVDVVVLMDQRESNKSRGFGFVTFEHPEELDRAQLDRPHCIDGRNVETKRAIPRNGRGDSNQSQQSIKKIYVASLHEDISENEFRDHFAQYGDVDNCTLVTEKETGRKRGFGFVIFNDFDVVDKLCLMNEHMINGHPITVKRAIPKEEMPGARAEAMRNERGRRVSMRDGRSGRDRDDYSNGGRYTRRSSSMGGPVRGASTGRMSSGMRGDEPRRRNFNDEKRNERFGSRMDNRMEEFDSYDDRKYGIESRNVSMSDEMSSRSSFGEYRNDVGTGTGGGGGPIRNNNASQTRNFAPYRQTERTRDGTWINGRNYENY